MKKVWLCVGLCWGVLGCETLGGAQRAEPSGGDTAPPVSAPGDDTLARVARETSRQEYTHLVVAQCQRDGTFAAEGVDGVGRHILFLVTGSSSGRGELLSPLMEAARKRGVPIVLYTGPVEVGGAGTSAPASVFDACSLAIGGRWAGDPVDPVETGGEPPGSDPGRAWRPPFGGFSRLAVETAAALVETASQLEMEPPKPVQ